MQEYGQDVAVKVLEESNKKSNYKKREVYGSFLVAGAEFAFAVEAVQEVVNEPSSYQSMPLAPKYLLGLFNLRGAVIPVIDLRVLFDLPTVESASERKVAIVEHGPNCIGILVDTTGEVFDAANVEKSEFLSEGKSASESLVKSVFKFEGGKRIVQVLDPYEVLGLERVPKSEGVSVNTHRRKDFSTRKQVISFVVGDSNCAIDIKSIQEIVQIEKIDNQVLKSELCLGAVNLRGATVPIVDFEHLLGYTNSSKAEERDLSGCKVVIMRHEVSLFGLLVESVESIISYFEDELIQFPVFSEKKKDMYEGCICRKESEIETIVLNPEKILARSEVEEITKGHKNLFSSEDDEAREKLAVGEMVTYLCFTVGEPFAVQIKDVNEVLSLPKDLMSPPGLSAFYRGVFNLRGEMIPVIDPNKVYSLSGSESASDEKLLVFSIEGTKYSLVVDSIDSIVSLDSNKTMNLPEITFKGAASEMTSDVSKALQFSNPDGSQANLLILSLEAVVRRTVSQAA